MSDELRITRVDPHDEEALRAWYAVYHAGETTGRPYVTAYMYEEIRATAQAPAVGEEVTYFLADVAGVPVCAADLELPLKDNRSIAGIGLRTHPAHRRRGHASRVLARLEEEAAARGRTVLLVMADYAYERGASGAGDPGVEFLRRHGYTLGLADVQRRVDVPLPEELLTRLLEETAPHRDGYTLRHFGARCPDELLESYGRLLGMLITEAPKGGLPLESEVFDTDRLRHDEAVLEEAGRTRLVTVAVDAAGTVVGYTELQVPGHEPGRAYQWGTLVHPDHRGHRLGLALKAANHLRLQEQEPGVREVVTDNAEVNDHMVAVNALLGFRPTGRSAEFQKTL